mmetsp:Transcript_61179/g.117971  ORF Transcript_61179/g.117971 Transcript_61179/m.117971 type:complete len:330 (+) Transcript_61179:46-1035(+)
MVVRPFRGRMARRSPFMKGDTLILLDVDGVLNVSVPNADGAVLFSQDNLRQARRMVGRADPVALGLRMVAARSLAHHGEDDTYEKLAAGPNDLSELLVSRLARLINAAGRDCHVVLSSTWRNPQHAEQVRLMENSIAKHLDRSFTFDARTALRPETGAMDRLECLGDYIFEFCQKRVGSENGRRGLRILVFDDFSATPLSCCSCRGSSIDSSKAAQDFLQAQAGTESIVPVRVVHTMESWTTNLGNHIAVGCGLTMQHFCNAMKFLGGGSCNHLVSRTPSLKAAVNIAILELPASSQKRWCSGAMLAWPRLRKRNRAKVVSKRGCSMQP